MTPQILVGVAGVGVALLAFLLGTFRARAASDGGMAADVATLKTDVASVRSTVTAHGNQIAALEQAGHSDGAIAHGLDEAGKAIVRLETLIEALSERLEDRYDATRALYKRLDDLAQTTMEIKTLCNERSRQGHHCTTTPDGGRP